MTQKNKTKEELIEDIKFLQKRIAECDCKYTRHTKCKQAEAALQESEERYRLFAETATDIIWTVDLNMHLTYINPSVTRVLGWTVEEAMARTMKEAFTPASFEAAMRILAEEMAVEKTGQGDPHRSRMLELELFHKDGTAVPVEAHLSFLRDSTGKPVSVLFILRDITERKKIENMLQKQQEEQQIILDSVPAWIFYKDKNNRFIRVNKNIAEVMGMSKKQLEGKSVFDLYSKEQAEAYWKDDKEVMVSGKPKRNIIEPMETKKGSLWVQTDKIPYRDAQGNIIGIIGFTLDITERKQAETELKESHEQLRILARHLQKDRETERARIAKELHDELGQTLTAIKIDYVYLQKKLGLLQKPLRKEIKDLSSMINTTINTVRKLTMDLRPVMLDDLGLIPTVEWMIKGVQKRTGIKVELTIKPVYLRFNPDLSLTIFRIIQEALTNVTRYAQATRVQIMLGKGSDGLNFTIKDNGIGIHQKQIKSPYSLGLIGMRERVISHDGTLEITGEKGKGTTITVFFPPPLKKGKNENTDR